jgi:hypothetical protein
MLAGEHHEPMWNSLSFSPGSGVSVKSVQERSAPLGHSLAELAPLSPRGKGVLGWQRNLPSGVSDDVFAPSAAIRRGPLELGEPDL